ncbi:unnamed protein product [Victoria cruziana]
MVEAASTCSGSMFVRSCIVVFRSRQRSIMCSSRPVHGVSVQVDRFHLQVIRGSIMRRASLSCKFVVCSQHPANPNSIRGVAADLPAICSV